MKIKNSTKAVEPILSGKSVERFGTILHKTGLPLILFETGEGSGMETRNMKPRSLFRLFQSERKRLSAESRSGTLESIFYSDKHSSIQYRINSPEQSGVFTVVFSQDKNDLW